MTITDKLDQIRRRNLEIGRAYSHVVFRDCLKGSVDNYDHERIYDRELALEVGHVVSLEAWHGTKWFAVASIERRFIEWDSHAALVQFIVCEPCVEPEDARELEEQEIPIR
jgi:hypothetical protein